ncbi:dephospho-CoA kinase [Helicobacter burdigaliensis]|uniref:dephospho-CoA kinase n=1 Tax=Helicobacter burdigaliensis TaxID=2315334 RepID=UPI000EF65121|nr:dephospho-CoA kinase [Helicobacter burdigaliensis]
MNLKYAIALSGGIGSGKSTSASLLKLYGYKVICADTIAHKVLQDCKKEVIEEFGEEILENEKINRKKLGKIVFSNKDKKQKLEALLHPKIKEEILKLARLEEEKKIFYFIDIPLFFETKNYAIKESLLIYAPQNLQIERIMSRDGCTKEEALKKISSQISMDEKKKMSSYVIENVGDLEDLQRQIENYLKNYLPNLKIY